jgi:hypothetical protein
VLSQACLRSSQPSPLSHTHVGLGCARSAISDVWWPPHDGGRLHHTCVFYCTHRLQGFYLVCAITSHGSTITSHEQQEHEQAQWIIYVCLKERASDSGQCVSVSVRHKCPVQRDTAPAIRSSSQTPLPPMIFDEWLDISTCSANTAERRPFAKNGTTNGHD